MHCIHFCGRADETKALGQESGIYIHIYICIYIYLYIYIYI